MSRRVVAWFAATIVVLGLGGGLADNYLNAGGTGSSNPTSVVPVATLPTIAPNKPRLGTSMSDFMGVTPERGTAPAFTLTDPAGSRVSLASLRHKVVVLSFFEPTCQDICPVIASELRYASRDLGPAAAAEVAFVTVNADPLVTSLDATRSVGARSGLSVVANWSFLTGSLPRLDGVWRSYGITVDVASGAVAHNDLIWFISPSGRLAYRATPFANEQRANGTYTLAMSQRARWGRGIAAYASHLLPSSTSG
ncbi:MAG TPA: SCO family protein [Acidimicrobiales bacterium]|nr:SCO family protein [Acidimicrobiales bacterium]